MTQAVADKIKASAKKIMTKYGVGYCRMFRSTVRLKFWAVGGKWAGTKTIKKVCSDLACIRGVGEVTTGSFGYGPGLSIYVFYKTKVV